MSLLEKYFFLSTDEYYTFGKFVEELDDGFYLVHKTGCDKPHYCIFHLFHLADDGEKSCQIFDTEKELNDYVVWIEKPSDTKENVLKLVKKYDDKI